MGTGATGNSCPNRAKEVRSPLAAMDMAMEHQLAQARRFELLQCRGAVRTQTHAHATLSLLPALQLFICTSAKHCSAANLGPKPPTNGPCELLMTRVPITACERLIPYQQGHGGFSGALPAGASQFKPV